MRSKYSTMSGLCLRVNRFASAMIFELCWMSALEGCKPGVSMSRSVTPRISWVTTRAFFVSVRNASAAAVPSPRSELMVELLPTPDLPSRRIVHVNPKSLVVPSRRSADSASATARSKEEDDPRPPEAPAPAPPLAPLLSCSASSSR